MPRHRENKERGLTEAQARLLKDLREKRGRLNGIRFGAARAWSYELVADRWAEKVREDTVNALIRRGLIVRTNDHETMSCWKVVV